MDLPDVGIVCNAGLPSNGVNGLQRGGRVGRRDGDTGLYVIFFEPWALEISLDDFCNGDANNPDRPRAPLSIKSKVRDRTPLSAIALLRCDCIRTFFAAYLGDTSSTGICFTQYLLHCDNQLRSAHF